MLSTRRAEGFAWVLRMPAEALRQNSASLRRPSAPETIILVFRHSYTAATHIRRP